MPGFLASAFSGLGLRVLGGLAVIGAVLAVLLGARQAGRNAERVETLQRTTDVQRKQLEAGARRPRDRDELAGRLRDGSF